MVLAVVFVFLQQFEASSMFLFPLHIGFQKEVFCDEIQILDEANLRIWTQALWWKHGRICGVVVLALQPRVLGNLSRCLDLVTGTCWWRQKASALALICPQLRGSVGTNSPLSTPVNLCSLHHLLGNLWCIPRHKNGTIPLWNAK